MCHLRFSAILSQPCWHNRICLRGFVTSSRSSAQVRVVEVGPRDGLQNEHSIINLETKLDLIKRLSKTGLRNIEAGAFVSPKWVPQMAHSSQILEHLRDDMALGSNNASYSFLVPNLKGLEAALSVVSHATIPEQMSSHTPSTRSESSSVGSDENDIKAVTLNLLPSSTPSFSDPLHEISVFTAATETFSQRNTNCSISESLQRFQPVITLAKSRNIRVRAYISVVLGCPYEGPNVSPQIVADLSNKLIDLGADEISLGDTTGMGTVPRTLELLRTLERAGIDRGKLAVHFHDTYGQALVNSAVALEHGIRIFDSSVAGLGGCPYAKGATGNVATEDLVYFLHGMGMDTGVNLEELAKVGHWISTELKRDNGSRVGKAILNKT